MAPDLDLEIWRHSPGCGGVYLDGPFNFYTLRLTASVPVSISVAGRDLGYPADPLTFPIYVVPSERAFVQVTLQQGDVPLPGQALTIQKYSGGAFVPYASLTTDAAGHASFTADRPNTEAIPDTYSVTYAESGVDCSAVPTPAGCHVAVATVVGSCVSGLGDIDGNGFFSAGTRAGFLTVSAVSPSHTWVGTAPAHVQFTNVNFLGTWTGTQTCNPASVVTTDAGTIAGSTFATCTASGATLTVVDCGIPDGGCGAVDPLDQLSLQYEPCNNFNHNGQAKDLAVQSEPVTGRADDLFFSVVDIDGGTITIRGDFTISGPPNEYFLQRDFTLSKPW